MIHAIEGYDTDKIRALVMREKLFAISEREWKHRVRGYGYGITESDRDPMVTHLSRGSEICALYESA